MRPLCAYYHTPAFVDGVPFSGAHTRENPFRLPLEVHSIQPVTAAIPPPAALCLHSIRIYLLFLNGFCIFDDSTVPWICQGGARGGGGNFFALSFPHPPHSCGETSACDGSHDFRRQTSFSTVLCSIMGQQNSCIVSQRGMGKKESGGLGEKTQKGKGDKHLGCAPLPWGCLPKTRPQDTPNPKYNKKHPRKYRECFSPSPRGQCISS